MEPKPTRWTMEELAKRTPKRKRAKPKAASLVDQTQANTESIRSILALLRGLSTTFINSAPDQERARALIGWLQDPTPEEDS